MKQGKTLTGLFFLLLESFINGSMILEAAKNLDEIVL